MNRARTLVAAGALGLGLAVPALAVVPGAMRLPPDLRPRYGLASFYCCYFHGRTAADGSRFDENAMTAASRTLPFGTMARVRNLRTGLSVVVRITDRGPFHDPAHRIIDLSRGAAREIGGEGMGVFPVEVLPLP
jgi:rare lipoprotein A